MIKFEKDIKILSLLAFLIIPVLLFTGCTNTQAQSQEQSSITTICPHENAPAKVNLKIKEPSQPVKEGSTATFRFTFKNEGEFDTNVHYILTLPFARAPEEGTVKLKAKKCTVIKNSRTCKESSPVIRSIRVQVPKNAVSGNYILHLEYPYEGYASATLCLLDPDYIAEMNYEEKVKTVCSVDDIIPICKAASPVTVLNVREDVSDGKLTIIITLSDSFATETPGKYIGVKSEKTEEYFEKRVEFDEIALVYGDQKMDIREYCFGNEGYYVDFEATEGNTIDISCEDIPLDEIISYFGFNAEDTKLRGRTIKLEIKYHYMYEEEYMGEISVLSKYRTT